MKKPIIISGIILFAACFLCIVQAYISMYEYKSKSFVDSYLIDIAGFSFIIIIFPMSVPLYFPLFYLLFKKVNAKYKSILLPLLLSVMFMVSCFLVNDSIFLDRVAAWSTFTVAERLNSTLLHSYITIPIATIIFYLIAKWKLKK